MGNWREKVRGNECEGFKNGDLKVGLMERKKNKPKKKKKKKSAINEID